VYLRAALATSPERPSILRTLGTVCRKTNRRMEALAFYERALQFEKDPQRFTSIADAIAELRAGR
jgi:uncharacterized protein HemY